MLPHIKGDWLEVQLFLHEYHPELSTILPLDATKGTRNSAQDICTQVAVIKGTPHSAVFHCSESNTKVIPS